MGARDSDDDLRKFLPDLATILREADPAYAEKKLREALDNPELDEALAEARRATGERPSPYAISVARAGAAAPKTEAAPKSAPAAVKGDGVGRTRALPTWVVYTLAVFTVLGPAAMVMVLVKTPPAQREQAAARSIGAGSESAGAAAIASSSFVVTDAGVDAGMNPAVDARIDAGAAAHVPTPSVLPADPPKAKPAPAPARAPLLQGRSPQEPAPASGPAGSEGSSPEEAAPTQSPPQAAPDMAP